VGSITQDQSFAQDDETFGVRSLVMAELELYFALPVPVMRPQ